MKNYVPSFEEFINESSINEDSYAEKSMLIRGSEKEKSLDVLKRNMWFFSKDSYRRLDEADMSREYDGFIVYDSKDKKSYKFKYERGNNVPQENVAIKSLMDFTKSPRGNFMVNGFVRKGEWNKDPNPEFKD